MKIPVKRFILLKDFLEEHRRKKDSLFFLNLCDISRVGGATQEGYEEIRKYFYERSLTQEELKKRKSRGALDQTKPEEAQIINAMLDHISAIKMKVEGYG